MFFSCPMVQLACIVSVKTKILRNYSPQRAYLFRCVVAGHLYAVFLFVNEKSHDKKYDYRHEEGRQNPGHRLVNKGHFQLGRDLLTQTSTISNKKDKSFTFKVTCTISSILQFLGIGVTFKVLLKVPACLFLCRCGNIANRKGWNGKLFFPAVWCSLSSSKKTARQQF